MRSAVTDHSSQVRHKERIYLLCGAGDTVSVSKESYNFSHRCSLSFIDFEGRSDGDSIRRILSIVKPRQLVSTLLTFLRTKTNYAEP